MKYKYHIYSQLNKYVEADKSFHMPGHKGRGEFLRMFPVAEFDITELSYSDNLACPSGVIARAEADIAEILGAKRSRILTDGSTCGVLTMMYVAAKRGKKLIVPRNCHQSVWNGCKLFGIEPVVARSEIKNSVLLPPSAEEVERLVASDGEIVGMIATHPDYYGNMSPLSEYSAVLKRFNRLLFVDGAHGAHLAFEPERRGHASEYADIWVDGAHKSLQTLTQGAILSINNERLLSDADEGLLIFRTSSPSYPVMASVEYGVKFAANYPELLQNLKASVRKFIEGSGFTVYPSDDLTKLAIDFKPLNLSSFAVDKLLEERGIYSELSDGRYILFYLSALTDEKDLNKLCAAIKEVVSCKSIAGSYSEPICLPEASVTRGYQFAIKSENEEIDLNTAAGRICARNAGITPPCVPVIVAGEIITEGAVEALKNARSTFGLTKGKITVVKK